MINKDIKLIEAILFASGEPIEERDLSEKIKNKKELINIFNELKEFYKSRGINLVKTGTKWSFRTAQDLSDDLTIFKTQKENYQELLWNINYGYQQPITDQIENIRGVQMGRGSIDHLMEIGWIKPSGEKIYQVSRPYGQQRKYL